MTKKTPTDLANHGSLASKGCAMIDESFLRWSLTLYVNWSEKETQSLGPSERWWTISKCKIFLSPLSLSLSLFLPRPRLWLIMPGHVSSSRLTYSLQLLIASRVTIEWVIHSPVGRIVVSLFRRERWVECTRWITWPKLRRAGWCSIGIFALAFSLCFLFVLSLSLSLSLWPNKMHVGWISCVLQGQPPLFAPSFFRLLLLHPLSLNYIFTCGTVHLSSLLCSSGTFLFTLFASLVLWQRTHPRAHPHPYPQMDRQTDQLTSTSTSTNAPSDRLLDKQQMKQKEEEEKEWRDGVNETWIDVRLAKFTGLEEKEVSERG